MSNKTLIVDLNNLAFVIRFSVLKTPKSVRKKDPDATTHIFYSMLDSTARFAKKLGCNSIVVACDSKKPWRREIYPDYKGNKKTEKDIYFSEVIDAADMYKAFMSEFTASMVLEVDNCEADDIIGYWCLNKPFEDDVVIFSTDGDYTQLLSDTVSIYSHSKKDFVTSTDPQLDLFIKCIRGDRSDNIPSAYPRVRKTKLEDAYESDEKLLNLLETVLPEGEKVGDQFDLNNKLIDLSMIPSHIKQKIQRVIDKKETGSFSGMKVMAELSRMGLKAHADMLEERSVAFRGKPVPPSD